MFSIFKKRTNSNLEGLIRNLENDISAHRISEACDDLAELRDFYQELLDNGTLSAWQQEHYDDCICRIACRLHGIDFSVQQPQQ